MNTKYLEGNKQAFDSLRDNELVYLGIKKELIKCILNDNKLMFCGNGGSASDSNHMACDFLTNCKVNGLSLKAISLNSNISTVTALSNDYSYDDVFVKQLEVMGNENDIIIGLSTSGTSSNVIKCLDYAKAHNMKTVLITGKNKNGNYDYEINIDSTNSTIIQNMYMIILHMLCLDLKNYEYRD